MNSINIKLKKLLLVLVSSFVIFSLSAKEVVFVKSGSSGDGSSWSKAFGSIQQAINSAVQKRADVWVAKGVYKSDSTAVVFLKPNVNLYGGFAGNETSMTVRDTAKNPTVLDGGQKMRVIFQENHFADSTAVVVDGFIIQNGYAEIGGGVYLAKNTTLNNCILRNNTATSYGLAIYANYAKIKNSIICDNNSNVAQKNVYLFNSEMDNCIVRNNTANHSSGVYATNTSTISNSTIDNNKNIITYANATVVTFNSVILIFLIAVLSDALIIIMSPIFISVFTLLK